MTSQLAGHASVAPNANRLRWTSASLSHVGKVRHINEDSCLSLSEMGLWAVADGMGGHKAGDVASRIIISELSQLADLGQQKALIEGVKARLLDANRKLLELSSRFYERRTMGSTVVVLLTWQDRGACLWVGDSRLYLLRQGQLQQLTHDHSYVQELVDWGLLEPGKAHSHPMGNVITRAIGHRDELEIDMIQFSLQPGDAFLLCSDGLSKLVSEVEMAILLSCGGCQDTVRGLIDLALARGARDNVTAVVVEVGAPSTV